jgi:hypothetical protein
MTEQTISEQAERLSRRRARMLTFLAIIFLTQQVSYFSAGGDRTVDHVKIGAWVVMSVVRLFAFGTGGAGLRPKAVRDLASVESTRVHRLRASAYGFWAAMGCALGVYAVDLFEPVSGRDAVHLVFTAGIATALLNFAMLERRAMRDA